MSLTDYAAVVIAIVLAVLALGGAIEVYGKHKDLERRLDRIENPNDAERGSDGDSIYENWDRSDAHIAPYHILDVQAAYQAGCGRCLYLLDRVNSAFTGALGERDDSNEEAAFQELDRIHQDLVETHDELLNGYNDLRDERNALVEKYNALDYEYRRLKDRHADLRYQLTQIENRKNGTTTPEPDDWNEIMQEKPVAAPVKSKRPYTRKKATPAPLPGRLIS